MNASNPKPSSRRRAAVATGVIAAIAATYAGYRLWNLTKTGAPQIESATLERLFDTQFADLANQQQALKTYRGKVIVLNFWATWCPPCRQEMPAFSKIQDTLGKNGIQVIGVGIDSPSAIKEFALQFPVTYPLLMGGTSGLELMRELGNTNAALPFTVVFRPDGNPAFSHLGMLTEETLKLRLQSLLPPGNSPAQ